MQPGDLAQIKRGVHGQGEVGIVVGESIALPGARYAVRLLDVLFHDGIRQVHPSNLQAPDGRTRPRP